MAWTGGSGAHRAEHNLDVRDGLAPAVIHLLPLCLLCGTHFEHDNQSCPSLGLFQRDGGRNSGIRADTDPDRGVTEPLNRCGYLRRIAGNPAEAERSAAAVGATLDQS